jgi:hypothetical protein
MGWNSWDCYSASVNESEVRGNAEYMAAHLKAYGWEYVVVDIQMGGIGTSRANEAFTSDYDLPNESAYSVLCILYERSSSIKC